MGRAGGDLIYTRERLHSSVSKLSWGPSDPALPGVFRLFRRQRTGPLVVRGQLANPDLWDTRDFVGFTHFGAAYIAGRHRRYRRSAFRCPPRRA